MDETLINLLLENTDTHVKSPVRGTKRPSLESNMPSDSNHSDLLRTLSIDVPGSTSPVAGTPPSHNDHHWPKVGRLFHRKGHEDHSPQQSPGAYEQHHHHPLLGLFHRDYHHHNLHHHFHHPDTITEGELASNNSDREFAASLTDALAESPQLSRARSPHRLPSIDEPGRSAFSPFKRASIEGTSPTGRPPLDHFKFDSYGRRFSAPSPEPINPHHRGLFHLHHHNHHHHRSVSPENGSVPANSPSPEPPHHRHGLGISNRSINDLLRQLGRKVVGKGGSSANQSPTHSPRRTSCYLEVPKHGSPEDPGFRSRARSLDDAGIRHKSRPLPFTDCATTYHIYEEIIREGKYFISNSKRRTFRPSLFSKHASL